MLALSTHGHHAVEHGPHVDEHGDLVCRLDVAVRRELERLDRALAIAHVESMMLCASNTMLKAVLFVSFTRPTNTTASWGCKNKIALLRCATRRDHDDSVHAAALSRVFILALTSPFLKSTKSEMPCDVTSLRLPESMVTTR